MTRHDPDFDSGLDPGGPDPGGPNPGGLNPGGLVPADPDLARRRLVAAAAALAGVGPAAAQPARPPTPSQPEGPFYPVEPIAMRRTLHRPGAAAARGVPLALSGRLLRGDAPLAGARVEIWQCDAGGLYRHPRQDGGDAVDPGFAGFGAQPTDDAGRWAFETIVPVPYPGRPPHIHVRVRRDPRPDAPTLLVTQLYLAGQDREPGLGGWLPSMRGARERLLLHPAAAAAAGGPGVAAAIDIVLG